ncbi:MAG: HD domain-containing protein [Actinobacteria bacterium]|nr:MAG: HD domain-containing protein [Actinomycetota bacterium]
MGQLRPVRSEERTATVLSMPDEESLPVLDEAGVRDQLLAFARDLNRIYHKERARAEELEHTLHELEESYFATVKTLAFVVEARDAHTRSHLSRAHDYAVALAQRVKPELADDRVFRYGFLLHDIGKVGIPDHILRKPSPLTREEWEVMQTHPILGGQMLGPIRFLQRAIPIVECHHERWDGKGYPRGLKGEEIPLAARIFSVVDTFDAMTSDRPYRRALSVDEAVHEILAAGGTQLDPAIAEAFAALCRERSGAWPIAHGTTDVD